MNIGSMVGSVRQYILDLPDGIDALVTVWINEAVRKAASRHNFRDMEKSVDVVTTPGLRFLLDKPQGWKEARGLPYVLRQDGSTRLLHWAPSSTELHRMFHQQAPAEGSTALADEGEPAFIYEAPEELHVYPLPDAKSGWGDGSYRITVPYWSMPSELPGDPASATNWALQRMPFYVLYRAVAEGMLYNRDEQRSDYYLKLAEREFSIAVRKDKLSRLPDRLTLAPRSGVRASVRNHRL